MHSRTLWGIAAGSLLLVACGGNKFQPHGGSFFTPPPATPPPPPTGACTAARSSEPLVPRVDLTGMSASTLGGQDVAYTSDLFGTFYAFCGGCHVDGAQGTPPRHIDKNVNAFVAGFDASWLAPIMLDAPTADKMLMPPPGKPWSQRTPGDPVYNFVMHAQSWLSAGKPAGVYAVDNGAGGGSTADYTFSSSVAAAMTNIGNCVPTATLFASSTSDVMTSKDESFKGASELPGSLADTDLTTLDSEELAKTAVIAYAPTYALWSAGSGKLRHVRVPRGQSVKFDKTTQTFQIPDNTRFYKTFLRKVKDRTGAVTWRKMETRLIVARADDTDPATGAARQNALFGTYIWNEDETAATLATLPYRDQTLWADIVRTYITDELLYQQILDTTSGTVDGAVARTIAMHPDDPQYRDLLQHYAIPGRLRCVQCHMGSATRDFVLGFIPLQVNRRETGTGGSYDVTGADELTQLQRLIDVGVITGVSSPDDLKPLEESEGTRTPRKTASADGDDMTVDGELKAQAYMLGNCAHCHNPRGFPSVTKPELTNMLNFLPDGKDGGIFGFPFERFSPIRTRGSNGDIPIPYITPSLRDYPTTLDDGLTRIDTGENIVNSGAITYTSKSFPAAGGAKACDDQSFDLEFSSFCGDRTSGPPIVAAPWRSLIYRNVDTPAAYFDDFVPFPHMPMNTAGYDCRAPRIMGDWMTGLPSVRKLTQLADLLGLPEMAVPSEDTLPKSSGRAPVFGALTTGYDDNPQPYVEVPPGNPLYARALTDARARMVEYHAGVRYPYCQDVISPDIFDPFVPVVEPQYTYHPDPYEYQFSNIIEQPPLDPIHPDRFVQPRIGVPFHAHWINYDPTDPPPPWVPRRTDWQDIIVGGKPDTQIPAGSKSLDQLGADAASAFRRKRGYLARALAESELSDKLRTDATTDRAFGTWVRKPGCVPKLTASQQTVSQLMSALGPGETPPAWINFARPAPDAFVYKMSPGAAIFRHVCINCHGPNADGKGIQVDLLASASEGEARPANFKQGLFGPPEAPLSNIATTFDVAKTGDMSAANLWASRYMAWMALGGTLKRIPQDILHLVISTPMLGYHRDNILSIPGSTDSTGNMLNLAKGLCAMMLPAPTSSIYPADYENLVAFSYRVLSESGSAGAHYPPYNYDPSPLISSTYDREMWLHLCNDFSPQVIRVYGTIRGAPEAGKPATIQLIKMYYAIDPDHANDPSYTGNFPANAQIWDPTKTTQPQLTRDNFYPACLDHLKIPDAQLAVGHAPGSTAPLPPDCPDAFLRDAKPLWIDDNLALDADQQLLFAGNVQVWELRGAIAAGMSVFSYLEKRLTDPSMAKLSPYYDQCDLLP